MRRLTLAVGSAAGALALTTTVSPALAAPSTTKTLPSSFASQRIDWKPCFDKEFEGELDVPPLFKRFHCGSMTVPLDWANPSGKAKVTIQVSRLRPIGGKPKGVVLTNPGGPGGPGLTLPLALVKDEQGRSRLADAMDIVGIDVRGTGASSTVTCGSDMPDRPLDPRNRSKANVAKLLKDARALAQRCQQRSKTLGRYVNTWQTVRDLDLLRSLLGQERIHWLGYSGGSWLGAHYATAFPKRVGRFVLDSNTEFTASWQKVFANQAPAFERRFRKDFAGWAARHDRAYKLGRTADRVRRTYEAIRADLARHPMPMLDGPDLHAVELDGMIASGMYSKYQFTEVAHLLRVLRRYTGVKVRSTAARTDVARAVRTLRTKWTPLNPGEEPAWDADMATFYSVTCNDTPRTGSAADLVKRSAAAGRKYPLVGYSLISDPCQYWKRPAVKLPAPTGKGVPPVLMVQSVNDPATSYEGALAAHRRFAGSRMLTVTNEGDHAVYAGGNPCVDKVVDDYLVNGAVPRKDLSCKGMPLPGPDGAVRSQSSDRLSGNPLTRAAELAERYRLGR